MNNIFTARFMLTVSSYQISVNLNSIVMSIIPGQNSARLHGFLPTTVPKAKFEYTPRAYVSSNFSNIPFIISLASSTLFASSVATRECSIIASKDIVVSDSIFGVFDPVEISFLSDYIWKFESSEGTVNNHRANYAQAKLNQDFF
jgi:hypothetical protein